MSNPSMRVITFSCTNYQHSVTRGNRCNIITSLQSTKICQICQCSTREQNMRRDSYYTALVLLSLTCGGSLCNSLGLYPNVSLQGTGPPEITPTNTLFIYSWTMEEQSKYPGYVTAIEYCFQRTTDTPTRPVFVLFLLEPVPTGYTILQRVEVSTQDFSTCSNRGSVETCCLRHSLEANSWIRVPVPKAGAYGIYSTGRNRILGRDPQLADNAVGLQIPSDRKDDIAISTKLPLSKINHRLFNMIIENVTTNRVTPTSKTVHISSTSNGTEASNGTEGAHSQVPRTETTLSMSTTDADEEEDADLTEDSLSVMATVEIALGCFVLLMLAVSIGLWVILCHKARTIQRLSRNLGTRTDGEQSHHQPIYDPIYKIHETSSRNEQINHFFHRNPAYAYQGTRFEPRRPKMTGRIHHGWLI